MYPEEGAGAEPAHATAGVAASEEAAAGAAMVFVDMGYP